jgi:hypothetical protein
MEDGDDADLAPGLEPEEEHAGLDRDGAQGEEIVAGERRIRGIEEVGAQQQREHERAE